MIFVDSGAWFAAAAVNDPDHARAVKWLDENRESLLTTDFVLDEVVTLLRRHRQYRRAVDVARSLLDEEYAALHFVEPVDVEQAVEIVEKFSDKDWSFTDCTSKVVMARLRAAQAFSFDHHFRQFGSISIVP